MSSPQPTVQTTRSRANIVAELKALFRKPFNLVKKKLQLSFIPQVFQKCFTASAIDSIPGRIRNAFRQTSHVSWCLDPSHLGSVDAFVKISQREGIRTLWSGLPPTLVVALPNTVIYFTSYEQIRSALMKRFPSSVNSNGSPDPWMGGAAGGVARAWSVSIVSPVELIRTKLQSQNVSYKELSEVLSTQVKIEGISSLWRGWVPTVLRDIPFSVIYWYSYEGLKRMMNQQQPDLTFSMTAGALSGGLAGTMTLPLDVVKTHRQIEIGPDKASFRSSGSTWRILQNIYQLQGTRGLFTGLVPRLAKVMPACAIMISTYEYAKYFWRQRNFV
ncbi:unnamed protein product, partial [Meganyctiphanes norvegica]